MAHQEASILVIDDDLDILSSMDLLLKRHFSSVKTEQQPSQIRSYLNERSVDVFLLDMNFGKGEDDGKEGLYWLDYILEIQPHAAVVMLTAYGDVELSVEAIRKGAHDFLIKPWNNQKLISSVTMALKSARQKRSQPKVGPHKVSTRPDIEIPLSTMMGNSEAMNQVFRVIDKVALTDANVLILGENGTGKELIAREVHKRSNRSAAPFVHLDLGAISESLFDAELFGHVKGAFTDAKGDRLGRLALAGEGTLFLDEIGNLPEQQQSKLLTVLQNKNFQQLGSPLTKTLEARFIFATNQPIHRMVDEGRFRQDLLYRINTVEIRLPTLRERPDDIITIANFYLKAFSERYQKGWLELSTEAKEQLRQYAWPGNIRELRHAMERVVILSERPIIYPNDLKLVPTNANQQTIPGFNLEEHEKHLIEKALQSCKGNISHAAKALGLTRAALYRRLEKHDLL